MIKLEDMKTSLEKIDGTLAKIDKSFYTYIKMKL